MSNRDLVRALAGLVAVGTIGVALASGATAAAAKKAGAPCSAKDRTAKAANGSALTCKTVGGKRVWTATAPAATVAPQTTPATTPSSSPVKLSGSVTVDGSSTVFPLSEAAAELFGKSVSKDVKVTVGESGTGGGFKKFCNGEIDIADASRPITAAEKTACGAKGIKYDEFTVANDGLALVVNPSNNFAACLTTAQLKKIWDSGSSINNWKDIDPLFPDLGMKLYGAGTASGTFDYFSEAINGKAKQHRNDYNATEDDNVTVVGVAGSPGGLGYFGLSYALENANKVRIVKVDSGKGCIEPSTKTVQDGSYSPLGRPLFIYVSAQALKKPQVLAYVEYYLDSVDELAKRALFVPLTPPQKTQLATKLAALKV